MNATPQPRTAPLPIFPILNPRILTTTNSNSKPNNALPVWQQHIAYLPQAACQCFWNSVIAEFAVEDNKAVVDPIWAVAEGSAYGKGTKGYQIKLERHPTRQYENSKHCKTQRAQSLTVSATLAQMGAYIK